jgi:hypothetical protein
MSGRWIVANLDPKALPVEMVWRRRMKLAEKARHTNIDVWVTGEWDKFPRLSTKAAPFGRW